MVQEATATNHTFFTSSIPLAPSKSITMSQQTLIFTYGTLKRGFANHPLLEDLISHKDAFYMGCYVTNLHLPLVQGPYGVPFLLNLPGSGRSLQVRGELYAVSQAGVQRLDELEGITRGHYERLPITLRSEDGGVIEAEAYFAHWSFAEEMWLKSGEEGYEAYTEELAKDYVRRDLRPNNVSLRDAITLFCSSDPTNSLL